MSDSLDLDALAEEITGHRHGYAPMARQDCALCSMARSVLARAVALRDQEWVQMLGQPIAGDVGNTPEFMKRELEALYADDPVAAVAIARAVEAERERMAEWALSRRLDAEAATSAENRYVDLMALKNQADDQLAALRARIEAGLEYLTQSDGVGINRWRMAAILRGEKC